MGVISKISDKNNSFYGLSAEPIFAAIEKDVEQFEKMSVLKDIFFMNDSKNFAEKVVSKTSSRGFQPTEEGGAYPKDDFQEGYSQTFYHQTFKNNFAITREMVEDNKILDRNMARKEFTSGYGRLREEFGAAILAGGTGTTVNFKGKAFNTKSADGVALFSTAHTSITAGTAVQSNVYSNAFTDDILGQLETKMQNFKDDNGNPLAVAPDTIVIPNVHTLKKAVFAAIGADKDPASEKNGFNYQFGRWNVIVWPYLNQFVTGGDASTIFFLLDSVYNETVGGLMWFDRVPLEVEAYTDYNTGNWNWNGYARFSAGANNWRAVIAGGVSGGTTIS